MTDFTLADKSFPHLRGFAAFLLENCLQEAVQVNIDLAREVDLPLLKVFSHLSEPEFFAFVKGNLETFFNQLLEQTALEHAKETLRKWRSDTLPDIPRGGVATADLVLVYHVRKQLLLKFIDRYTTDLKEGIAIARELDVFYCQVEQYAFSLYVNLQEEEHKAVSDKLQEQQAELEEAYEELMASREELQQSNEKLREEAGIRKAAEEGLEKERSFLEAVLEHISDGIVACDENGVLSFFNKATRQFHGITEKALPPEQWSSYYNLYHGDGVTPLSKEEIPLFRAFGGEEVEGAEMVIAPVNGKKRLLLADGQLIVSSRGEKLGAVVVMHDITDLRKAQQQQQEAMQELQEINKELATALEELQATEEQLVEANHELEERVAARTKELAASEQKLQSIFMQAPVAIGIYGGKKHTIELINPLMSEILGRRAEELLEKELFEALPEVKGQGFEDILSGVYTTGTPFEANEIPATLQRGGKLTIGFYDTVYQPLRNADQDITGIIQIVTDVSAQVQARRKIEESEKSAQALAEELAAANEELQAASEEIQASNEELLQTNKQLSHINADMDNFIYTASHDLRAPISNIEGLMQAMMRNLPEENGESPIMNKLSGLIFKSIERFKRTINDLTQITRIQREGIGEDLVLLDLSQIIQDVKLDLAPQIKQAEAKSEIELSNCAPVHFSAKNARSIVYNLLSNAIKYRSPKRQLLIKVNCYSEGEYQVLSVEDNGLGMDLTDKDKIFAMFKRLHDHVEGSGVGLYIVKKIIDNAGGMIEVESKVDQGSIFRVYFKQ